MTFSPIVRCCLSIAIVLEIDDRMINNRQTRRLVTKNLGFFYNWHGS